MRALYASGRAWSSAVRLSGFILLAGAFPAAGPGQNVPPEWDKPYQYPRYVWHEIGVKQGDGAYQAENRYVVGTRQMQEGRNVIAEIEGFADWHGSDALTRDYNTYIYTDWVGGPYHSKRELCAGIHGYVATTWEEKVCGLGETADDSTAPKSKWTFWRVVALIVVALVFLSALSKSKSSSPQPAASTAAGGPPLVARAPPPRRDPTIGSDAEPATSGAGGSPPSRKPKPTGRAPMPFSQDFWREYPNYDIYSPAEVWHLIGDGLEEEYCLKPLRIGADEPAEACTARVSLALNRAGFPMPPPGFVTKKDKKGEPLIHLSLNATPKHGKERYIISAQEMRAYLKIVWGKPTVTVSDSQALLRVQSVLKPKQIAIAITIAEEAAECGHQVGGGHSAVLRAGYQDPYIIDRVDCYKNAAIWILPVKP